MDPVWIVFAIVELVSAGLCYLIAARRGLTPVIGWTLLGLVFGILAVLAALLARPTARVAAAPAPASLPGSSGPFCSQCGAPLPPDARFCSKCGRPVSPAAPRPQSFSEKYAGTPFATSAAPQPVPQAASANRVTPLEMAVGALILVVVLVGAVLVIRGGLGGTSVPASANLPPVGSIWFGSSFDTSTFELSGTTSSVAAGTTVALVAHLPRSISSGEANLRVSLNGQVVVNQAVNMTGSGDLFGTTVGPFGLPGTYTYELVDVGGNSLASGTLTVQ